MKILILKKAKTKAGDKIEYFRKLIMDHLDTLDDENDVMAKAKAAMVGETRDRKSGKYKKIGPNKWAKVYDSHTRGAKMAIAALKRKFAECKDAHEMLQLMLQHRDRFSDKDGHPLPFVQELSAYVRGKSDAIDEQEVKKEKQRKQPKKKPEPKPKKEQSKKKEWENPLADTDIPPAIVARTMANKINIERVKDPERRKDMLNSLINGEKYKLSKEDAEKFLNALANISEKDRKQAEHYADTIGAEEYYQSHDMETTPVFTETKWDFINGKITREEARKRLLKERTCSGKYVDGYLNAMEKEAKSKQEENHKFEKIPIGKVEKWLVDKAKEVGIDIDGYSHEITNHFVNHVMNEHGDEKTEKSRGNIAIKESDFNLIPEILKSPDFTIVGAKRGGQNLIIHSKKMEDGTTFYFEEVLSGETNKTLRGKTMYKRASTTIDEEKLKSIVTMNEKTDLSKAEVVIGGGSQPPSGANKNTDPAVATSADPADDLNISQSDEKSSPESEESEEEKRRNRSEAMKGNKNAYKGGPKEEEKAQKQMAEEEKEAVTAREELGLPPVEKHGRVSSMKDSTWDPKSEDYRYKDTGYIAGSRKELAQSYIKKMAKNGEQVTNEAIDWTGIEENEVAAAEIITKQNLMGKPDWSALQEGGLTGTAGYLINQIYKTIDSKPEKNTAENRYNFSRGLDAIKARLESCKSLDDVNNALAEIEGEISGRYISSKRTPEYLKLAEKKQKINTQIIEYSKRLKAEIFKNGDPFEEARGWFKKNMPWNWSIDRLFHGDGSWRGSIFTGRNQRGQINILKQCQEKYKKLQEAAMKEIGIPLSELEDHEREIKDQMYALADETDRNIEISNTMKSAWATFGKSFKDAVETAVELAGLDYFYYDQGIIPSRVKSVTFANHVEKLKEIEDDDFSWAEKKATGGGGERKTQFELLVVDNIVRKGGRQIKDNPSSAELKSMYNLRDVQLGNWVASDPKSAMFHVNNVAMGLADLADVTAIPDNLVSLNGRLAIALGARGHNKFLAHYEPVERVINITKMKGGGSLAHEWFHAFDNLIADAMTGGRYNVFLTESGYYDDLTENQRIAVNNMLYHKRRMESPETSEQSKMWAREHYEEAKEKAKKAGVKVDEVESAEAHITAVKAAFANLAKEMMTGSETRTEDVYYTKEDYEYVNNNKEWIEGLIRGKTPQRTGFETFEEAIKEFANNKWDIYYHNGKKYKMPQIRRFIAAYYGKEAGGGFVSEKTQKLTSAFYENSKKLESNRQKPYWSSILEMGARAFACYISDKLKEQGRENTYLAGHTENSSYSGHKPNPEGEERERINKAFDALFRVVNETNAIRKAIEASRISFNKPGAIESAIDGVLRFFAGLKDGKGSFEKKKITLNKAGEDTEAFRWVAEGENQDSDLNKSLTF